MDLKDMILVTENDRGTETNMLMTLDDYKSFIAVDDMSELADNLLQLGRTLGKADNFTEYYRAANVTVSARFCLDDIQLGQFLQGFYNDSKEFRFDKEASSSEYVKIKKIDEPTQSWSINQRGSTCPYGNCNQYEPLLLVYFRTGQVTG